MKILSIVGLIRNAFQVIIIVRIITFIIISDLVPDRQAHAKPLLDRRLRHLRRHLRVHRPVLLLRLHLLPCPLLSQGSNTSVAKLDIHTVRQVVMVLWL